MARKSNSDCEVEEVQDFCSTAWLGQQLGGTMRRAMQNILNSMQQIWERICCQKCRNAGTYYRKSQFFLWSFDDFGGPGPIREPSWNRTRKPLQKFKKWHPFWEGFLMKCCSKISLLSIFVAPIFLTYLAANNGSGCNSPLAFLNVATWSIFTPKRFTLYFCFLVSW